MKKVLLGMAIVIVFFYGQVVEAVGISPPSIRLNDIINGLEVERSVYISRQNADRTVGVLVKVDGDVAKYIKLSSTKLEWPQGQNNLSFSFLVNPTHAANGKYKGTINFVVTGAIDGGAQIGGTGTSFQEGASLALEINVTDQQIKMLKVEDVRIDDTEINVPPGLSINIKNEGNVDARPNKITMEFFDVSDQKHIIKDELNEQEIPILEALSSKRLQLKFHNNFLLGKYKGKVEVFLDDKLLYSKKDIILNVFPVGTLAQEAEFTNFDSFGNKFEPNQLIKFAASIKNTGKIRIEPVLYIEIKKDDKILEILRPESKSVGREEDTEYTITYRPQETGKYIAEAHFEYGIMKTPVKSIAFVVGSTSLIYYIIGGVILLAIVFGLAYFFFRKKEEVIEGGNNLMIK